MERCPSCDQPISDSLRIPRPVNTNRVRPNKPIPQDGNADSRNPTKTEFDGLSQAELYQIYHHEASESNWEKVQILEGLLDPTVDSKKWVKKPEKFLSELPPTVVFPLNGGTMTVTLIDDNPTQTLWYVKWMNDVYVGGDVVIRRKTSMGNEWIRALGYQNRVWISLRPRGRNSPSETGLRPFQNIGFDVYETF